MAANEPQLTISQLHRAFDDYGLNSLEFTNCLGIRQDSPIYTEKYKNKIEISSWFYDPAIRKVNTKMEMRHLFLTIYTTLTLRDLSVLNMTIS